MQCRRPRPAAGWRKLLGFNMLTGIVLGIVGWFVGHWIGDRIHGANVAYYSTEAGENDIAILLGYFLGVVGFLVGLGFANYPVKRLLGHPPTLAERESEERGPRPVLHAVAPTTRSSPSSTWSGSGCSSSSAG